MPKINHREHVLKILGLHKGELEKRYGVTRIGIFGSVARGESSESSDVDVVIELNKPDLFYLVHIKDELEEALSCHVDIVHYRKKMNKFLRDRIIKEAIYV